MGITVQVLTRSGASARSVAATRTCDGTQEHRILPTCIPWVPAFEILKEPFRLPIIASTKGRHRAREIVIVCACSCCPLSRWHIEGGLRLGQRRALRLGG